MHALLVAAAVAVPACAGIAGLTAFALCRAAQSADDVADATRARTTGRRR